MLFFKNHMAHVVGKAAPMTQHPAWALTAVPAAPVSLQLPANAAEGSRRWPRRLGPAPVLGTQKKLLVKAWPSTGCRSHWGE